MENLTEISRTISDHGFMAVAAAAYLLCSVTMFILLIRWFIKTVNRIVDKQQDVLEEILRLQGSQQCLLECIERRTRNIA